MSDLDRRAERAVFVYGGHIDAYCRRRLTASAVADAVAEVMAVVWRRRSDLPDEPGTLPWMYAVAQRIVLGARRSQRRWEARKDRVGGAAVFDVESVESQVMQADDERLVRLALGQLQPADQEILRLAAWEGLSNRQIAEVMGITAAAADQRLSRAKRRLADRFNHISSGRGGTR